MKKFGSAVILAGGKSTRMGFDKQLLKLKKKRLISIIVEKLNKEFNEIIIVTNKLEYYKGFRNKVITDEIKQKGPLSGIHAGLKEAESKYVYFIACDMPNINLDYIRYMKKRIYKLDIDACVTKLGEWIEPFNSFYSKDIVKDIECYLKDNRKAIYPLLKDLKTYYIEEKTARQFSPNWNMFLNLNTKKDLKKYVDLLDF
ncbi:molybdenum cofactor guanylyltransferase [Thermohalobacter berrensis]|uniref:Probable molybdenum cofactor guanylyltransferase n=1 Tax=Thermohalobacter berrensis TaxID=99594 RepID=A0A419T2H5_9FIRM|nr:molybdenum cofactor guanylyltransferase [Thermohalobacter berrensis]RKD31641.1 molybdenum cofactor guanylyltransferase [Thermohalobacter berrensis]